ncbi:MAG: D-Ala-D-Ala carboxypeptidase family metallohydrolase [Patescibacteria group bacterium]
MKIKNWERVKYFHQSEFDCPDNPGSGSMMEEEFVLLLDKLREKMGKEIIIISGFRTEEYNEKLINAGYKASPDSSHKKGFAVDIKVTTSTFRAELIKNALSLGINRIGISRRFVHLDVDPDKPQNVIWLY